VDVVQQSGDAIGGRGPNSFVFAKASDEGFRAPLASFQPCGNLFQRFKGLAGHLFRFDAGEAGQIVPLANQIDLVLLRRITERQDVSAHGRVMARQYFIDQFVIARQWCNIHPGDELRDLGKDKTTSRLFAFFIASRCHRCQLQYRWSYQSNEITVF